MKKYVMVALFCMMTFCLFGCGDSSQDKEKKVDVIGSWSVTGVVSDGAVMTLDEYGSSVGTTGEALKTTYEFTNEKTSVDEDKATWYQGNQTSTVAKNEFKWKRLSDTEFYLYFDKDTYASGTVKDGKMNIKTSSVTIQMEKN